MTSTVLQSTLHAQGVTSNSKYNNIKLDHVHSDTGTMHADCSYACTLAQPEMKQSRCVYILSKIDRRAHIIKEPQLSKAQTDGDSKGQLRANRWRQQRAAKGKQMETARGKQTETAKGGKWQTDGGSKGQQKAVSGDIKALHLASMIVCLTTRAVKATEVSMSSSLRVLLLMRCLCGSAWAVYQHVQNSCQHFIVQQGLLSRNTCKNTTLPR